MKHKVLFLADKENIETYAEIVLKEADVDFSPFREPPHPFKCSGDDLIVLDCGLDYEKGLALLKEFKKLCPKILLIFLTAAGSERIAIEAFRSGAREYFRKPVNLFELQSTIENLLDLKSETSEKRSHFHRHCNSEKVRAFDSTTTEKPVNLLRAVRYIEEHLAGTITLQDLADESSLSKFHFCRAFNKYFGLSPMTYLTSMRIQRAKELLSRDDLNVSTVAYELGYDSPGSFIRNFKKSTGFTPSAYRKHIKSSVSEAVY